LNDPGPQFLYEEWKTELRAFGATRIMSATYYLEGDGLLEWMIKILTEKLRFISIESEKSWEEVLEQVVKTFNYTPTTTTVESPQAILTKLAPTTTIQERLRDYDTKTKTNENKKDIN
jgi:hypothetical protein